MDLLEQLKHSLECPCCLETPKPDTTTVGMCSSGHTTCHSCGIKVLEKSTACPVCRQTTFQIVRGHKLAVSVIAIMTSFMIYSCKHANCQAQVTGDQLTRHEETCSKKPLLCPKKTCAYWGPLDQYMDGHHSRCVTVCPLYQATQTWHFVLNLNYLYSVDENKIKISPRYKPIILKGVTQNDYTSHAYINAEEKNGYAVIYCGWLNEKLNAEEKYQNMNINIMAYINTAGGKIGQFSCRPPKFQFDAISSVEDGIYLTGPTLLKWIDISSNYICTECSLRKGTPHLHVQVSFKK